MTKFFNNYKNPIFGPLWVILRGNNFCTKKFDSVMHNFKRVLTPFQNLEKTNYLIPKKHPPKRPEERKGRQMNRTFRLPPGFQQR